MKEIPLTQGKVSIVDDEDYEYLMQWKWSVENSHGSQYVERRPNGKRIYMHRIILNTPKGMETDHINHNTLDNRKCNIRICTSSQNQANSKKNRNNKTGRKGVYFSKEKNKLKVTIRFHDRSIHLGYYDDLEEASQAYIQKARELFGEFAYTG